MTSTNRRRPVSFNIAQIEMQVGALDSIAHRVAGRLGRAAGVTLDLQRTRIMVCGNPQMARELRAQLTARGFRPNRRATPGELAFEDYW